MTLHVRGELNGCIGSIEPTEALGVSAARHAWSAAFADPRLPQLRWVDYEHLDISISVLSPLAPTPARSRAELLGALQPRRDGLVISSGGRRAVFLPSVWKQLPDADHFLDHLAAKAGIDIGVDVHTDTDTDTDTDTHTDTHTDTQARTKINASAHTDVHNDVHAEVDRESIAKSPAMSPDGRRGCRHTPSGPSPSAAEHAVTLCP